MVAYLFGYSHSKLSVIQSGINWEKVDEITAVEDG
jgi:hypothetical protein